MTKYRLIYSETVFYEPVTIEAETYEDACEELYELRDSNQLEVDTSNGRSEIFEQDAETAAFDLAQEAKKHEVGHTILMEEINRHNIERERNK